MSVSPSLIHAHRMTLVGHSGHWLLWVLHAVPVLIVVGSIVVGVVRRRREGDSVEKLGQAL